jgi:hypothetical protein
MKTMKASFCLTACMALMSASAAETEGGAGLFAKGQKQFTVLAGTGYAFDEDYFVLGAGLGYYVMDGLNVGLQLETWTGGDPGILKFTASTQYVFYKTPRIAPYVGAFYRYTDIEDQSGIDSVGGRAGVYLQMGRNGYAGLGVVVESYLDCNTRLYVSCNETYPEISFAFTF